MNPNPRLIAFYLPQYHPIPENDEWWGRGFTEWTNVAKATSLFRGHYQPRLPADLGFYDLRLPEVRDAQAQLARGAGIAGFCYYHYWFGDGRQLLQRPLQEVVATGRPDFPFCVCWANESWSGIWHGDENRILIEQTYPGVEDEKRHFDFLFPAFSDHRYIRVDGKPLFVIYKTRSIPDVVAWADRWRRMAESAGLDGLHLVAINMDPDWLPRPSGFDAEIWHFPLTLRKRWVPWSRPWEKIKSKTANCLGRPTTVGYHHAAKIMLRKPATPSCYRSILHDWDNTARSGSNGLVVTGCNPEAFAPVLRQALQDLTSLPTERRILFLKSWNEWAEGNYLEPDRVYGRGYLDVIRRELAASPVGIMRAQSRDSLQV